MVLDGAVVAAAGAVRATRATVNRAAAAQRREEVNTMMSVCVCLCERYRLISNKQTNTQLLLL